NERNSGNCLTVTDQHFSFCSSFGRRFYGIVRPAPLSSLPEVPSATLGLPFAALLCGVTRVPSAPSRPWESPRAALRDGPPHRVPASRNLRPPADLPVPRCCDVEFATVPP